MKVKIGLIQVNPKQGDLEGNRLRMKDMIKKAMQQKQPPDLLLLPETWTSPYEINGQCSLEEQGKNNAETIDGESLTMLRNLARHHKVWIAAGSITLRTTEPDEKNYNAMFLIDRNGEITAAYEKIHLCAWANEDQVFAYGKKPVTAATEIGRLGMLICYDIRFPELSRICALNGAEILLIPACFGTSMEQWRQMVIARAVENQIFALGCGTCGEGRAGHSMAVAPDGTVLCEAGSEEAIVTAELDLEQIKTVRKAVTYLHDRRPALYKKYGLLN